MVVEEERDEETSQLWILRHLRLLLNDVEDSVLSSFILHQDCTPLRNFVNGYGRRRVLYIDVKRSEAPRRLSSLQPLSTTTDNEQKAWRAPAPLTIKKAMDRRPTRTKRKKKCARNMGTAVQVPLKSSQQELEPTKEEEVALNAEKSEHLREVEERAPEVALRWYDTQLPAGSNEFVFIVTKTQSSINFGFDQLFQVGICHSGQVYWRMIELATNILGCEVDEYVKVDLLLLFVDAGFRWIEASNKLKNFIVETIGLLHADSRKKDEADAVKLPNMQTLLRPRLQAVSHHCLNETERCRLLMELSLFDVDCIEQCADPKSAAQRLTCALNTLRLLHLLHATEHANFIRRATVYSIETVAKVAAIHIKRKALSILSGDKCESVWQTVGCAALQLFAFGASIMEKGSDEALDVQRIANCFALMETLEDEIDVQQIRIRKLTSETMDERSDMDRQRDALEQASMIVTQIGEEFEEKGIISVAESGNMDALKAPLIVAISAHFSTLSSLVSNRAPQTY